MALSHHWPSVQVQNSSHAKGFPGQNFSAHQPVQEPAVPGLYPAGACMKWLLKGREGGNSKKLFYISSDLILQIVFITVISVQTDSSRDTCE